MKMIESIKNKVGLVLLLGCLMVPAACGGDAKKEEDRAKAVEANRIAGLNAKDEHGRTPLHYAALRGQVDIVRGIPEAKVDVNAADRYRFTPLHYAARRGHLEVVRLLLAKKAHPDARDHYGCTPLHHAALKGRRGIAGLLVEAGANPEAKDKNGLTPAETALEEGNLELLNTLNPVIHAVKKGNIEKLDALLEKKTGREKTGGVNAVDWAGRTPLHHAYYYRQDAVVDFLLGKGAKTNVKDKYGNTPGHYSAVQKKKRTGVNRLDVSFETVIDNIVYEKLHKFSFINAGLVIGGEVAFTRSYGNNDVHKDYVYASVSKPLTAMIVMKLLVEGKIESLDDNIWKYSPRYKNCMPKRYEGTPLTIKHLLTYRSGVPHNREATWKNKKLNLKFKPGTRELYSTPGYGILGHVIEDAAGMSYSGAVKAYIGKPVGASSFRAEKVFKAPGARIHSNIFDMAAMVAGIMNYKYFDKETLYNQVYSNPGTGGSIGWVCRGVNTPDISVQASGSNGYPQAHIRFKHEKKIGVLLLAKVKNRNYIGLLKMGEVILTKLEPFAYKKP